MQQELPMPEEAAHKVIKMIATVAREIALRQRVYPRWVASGKMSNDHATSEISAMEDVLAYLQRAKAENDARSAAR